MKMQKSLNESTSFDDHIAYQEKTVSNSENSTSSAPIIEQLENNVGPVTTKESNVEIEKQSPDSEQLPADDTVEEAKETDENIVRKSYSSISTLPK